MHYILHINGYRLYTPISESNILQKDTWKQVSFESQQQCYMCN